MEREARAGFYFVGGYLCVDFVNTRHAEDGRVVEDLLRGPGDLARWLREAGILGPIEAGEAPGRWGEGEFRRAVGFRESLRGMIERVAGGGAVRPEEIEEKAHDLAAYRDGASSEELKHIVGRVRNPRREPDVRDLLPAS